MEFGRCCLGLWLCATGARAIYENIYMYTDRPIYRAGHTVYFRGIVRQAFNGRYELPPLTEIPLNPRDERALQCVR